MSIIGVERGAKRSPLFERVPHSNRAPERKQVSVARIPLRAILLGNITRTKHFRKFYFFSLLKIESLMYNGNQVETSGANLLIRDAGKKIVLFRERYDGTSEVKPKNQASGRKKVGY